ncbi:MAG: metallophosphoesterase family protein [Rikenellaceae bacterium]
MKRVGLISDTHGCFDEAVMDFLKDVDLILHAGDIGSTAVADQITAYKPGSKLVYGNIDPAEMRREFGEFESFEIEGVRILMTHIGGYPKRYVPQAEELIKMLRPKIFISGHSHILKVIYDPKYDLLHINPGAAGRYGIHKIRTAVRFTIDGDDIRDLEIGEWPRLQQC